MLLLVQSLVNREKEKYLLGCPEPPPYPLHSFYVAVGEEGSDRE
jgi:hypothetical protein